MLDLDTAAQLVASILSKKVAAGSTHVVIDIPVGPTAKVRDAAAAEKLRVLMEETGRGLGLEIEVVLTDGSQPVGHGIGPALEARDLLAVLRGTPGAPEDLRARSLALAARVLELGGIVPRGQGTSRATKLLDSGEALDRFKAICIAQGGFSTPSMPRLREGVRAASTGRVVAIDNRRLAQAAKLAGAPDIPAAGVDLKVRKGDSVTIGRTVLYEVCSDSPGALSYALDHVAANPDIIRIGQP